MVKTITQFTTGTASDLTGAAWALFDDATTHTRKHSLATLRTKMFAGGAGYTAGDPLVVGTIVLGTNTTYSAAQMQKIATTGLTITGLAGSGNDFTVYNPAGTPLIANPTGTTTLNFGGAVSVASGLTVSANGITVVAGDSSFKKIITEGTRSLQATNQVNGAGASLGTLANAPAAGNPTFWWTVTVNGSDYAIPLWPG